MDRRWRSYFERKMSRTGEMIKYHQPRRATFDRASHRSISKLWSMFRSIFASRKAIPRFPVQWPLSKPDCTMVSPPGWPRKRAPRCRVGRAKTASPHQKQTRENGTGDLAMALTRDFKETIQACVKRDPAFREELLKERVECLLSGGGHRKGGPARLHQRHNRIRGAWQSH